MTPTMNRAAASAPCNASQGRTTQRGPVALLAGALIALLLAGWTAPSRPTTGAALPAPPPQGSVGVRGGQGDPALEESQADAADPVQEDRPSHSSDSTSTPTAAQIYAAVGPSIAMVTVPTGIGSGILIRGEDNQLYVVTNAHVTWPHRLVRLIFPGERMGALAPVLATDWLVDLAVVGPIQTDRTPLPLVDGESLPVGDVLYLVGYPIETDDYPQPTIAQGILSRIREWPEAGQTVFQTDATIVGGQSGGALVSARGEVIGMSGMYIELFAFATSAADLHARIEGMIAGEATDGIGPRDLNLSPSRTRTTLALLTGWSTKLLVVDGDPGAELIVTATGEAPVWMQLFSAGGTLLAESRPQEDEAPPDDNQEDQPETDPDDASTPEADAHPEDAEAGPSTAMLETTLENRLPYFLVVAQEGEGRNDVTLESSLPFGLYTDPDDRVTLRPGEQRSGHLDHPDDSDLFRLRLEAGQRVEVLTSSYMIDARIAAMTEAGDPITDNDDGAVGTFGFDAGLILQAESDQTVLLEVHSARGGETGGYIIAVRDLTAQTGAPDSQEDGQEDAAVEESPHGPLALYRSATAPYTIRYPAAWTLVENPEDDGLTAEFLGPNEEGLGILEEDMGLAEQGFTDLDRYVFDTVFELARIVPRFQLLAQEERVTDQGAPYRYLEFSGFGGAYHYGRLLYINEADLAFNATIFAPAGEFEELRPLMAHLFAGFVDRSRAE